MPKKAHTRGSHNQSRDPKRSASENPSDRDLEALRIISTAVAVPTDLLARFLNSRRTEATKLVRRLEQAECLVSREFLPGDAPWVWLTGKGARLSGTGIRERSRPPALASLAHRRAIQQVRLDLETQDPSGSWIPEAQFYAEQRGSGLQIPDGVFEAQGKRLAVEVELSRKSFADLRRVLTEHCARYDGVHYYCGPRTRKQLSSLKRLEGWPKLLVRDLPQRAVARKQRARFPEREPTPREKQVLRLISEQGAVPLDQLTRFLGPERSRVSEIIEEFQRQNYARCDTLLSGEPDWVWLKTAGSRFAGTSLDCWSPRVGGLPRIRILNELRLHLEGAEARWLSKRLLRREFGRYAILPDAVLEEGEARRAILFRSDNRDFASVKRRIEAFHGSFDSVVCVCGSAAVAERMAAFGERHSSYQLVISRLPVLASMPLGASTS